MTPLVVFAPGAHHFTVESLQGLSDVDRAKNFVILATSSTTPPAAPSLAFERVLGRDSEPAGSTRALKKLGARNRPLAMRELRVGAQAVVVVDLTDRAAGEVVELGYALARQFRVWPGLLAVACAPSSVASLTDAMGAVLMIHASDLDERALATRAKWLARRFWLTAVLPAPLLRVLKAVYRSRWVRWLR